MVPSYVWAKNDLDNGASNVSNRRTCEEQPNQRDANSKNRSSAHVQAG
jgi:hypothetical protein